MGAHRAVVVRSDFHNLLLAVSFLLLLELCPTKNSKVECEITHLESSLHRRLRDFVYTTDLDMKTSPSAPRANKPHSSEKTEPFTVVRVRARAARELQYPHLYNWTNLIKHTNFYHGRKSS